MFYGTYYLTSPTFYLFIVKTFTSSLVSPEKSNATQVVARKQKINHGPSK